MKKSHSELLPFTVALTGGIASGKSVVSRRFEELGVPVIDTDLIARELVVPGSSLLAAIREHFGEGMLDADGQLRRRELRELVFKNAQARRWLEALLHPAIRAESRVRIARLSEKDTSGQVPGYCLLVIPLLVETGVPEYVNRVLVVDTSPAAQLERLLQRDGVTRSQAEAALAVQASREQRLAIADDVITNSGSLSELTAKVDSLHQQYLEQATARRSELLASRATPIT